MAGIQTFHSQIAANRRRSLFLVVVVVALLAALGFAIGFATTGSLAGAYVAIAVAVAVALTMSGVSYFAGDGLVLSASQAKEVTDADTPRLMNIVRELSIAANIPPPRVFIIDDTAPNAFATGRDPRHASIAVTTGLLTKLDREELQGVIAHELAHVRNLDIRFTLLVGVLVGSIVLIADVFLRWTFWGGGPRSSGGGRRDGGGALVLVMIVIALVLAILAPFLARMIQFAVSRQREYLADASSIELTRNPHGLERALAKIGADREVLEVANRATQHMYFVNPIKKWEERASSLLSTHPPIVERINRLRTLTGAAPIDLTSARSLAGLE